MKKNQRKENEKEGMGVQGREGEEGGEEKRGKEKKKKNQTPECFIMSWIETNSICVTF